MSSEPTARPLGLGVVGLGRGFMLTLPSLLEDERVRLVAAAAPREASRMAFEKQIGGRSYETVQALCNDPDVEAIYVASPHQMHADHADIAAAAGKHMLVEKPLAVSMEDGARMVKSAKENGVYLIVGPSHSFDGPVQQARAMIASGGLGRAHMIQAFNYTDFLYRPRRAEELSTEQGGGVLFSQAIHQIDIVRLLAGGLARTVTAKTGAWDRARPTEGAYAALIDFEAGCFASLTYSGYAHFDSDDWMGWITELGQPKDRNAYGGTRKALSQAASAEKEAALKTARTFGQTEVPPPARHNEHFGPVIMCCERGDLRLTPEGIWFYGDNERKFLPAPPQRAPRAPVIDALFAAVREGKPPLQSGEWGLASLEVCHAMLQSARSGAPVELKHQVAIAACT